MSSFQATHKLIAPAGEEIPVMLVSQRESVRYRAIAEEEHEEGSEGIYEWHPSEGVTYKGYKLEGLEIVPLDSAANRRAPAAAAGEIPPQILLHLVRQNQYSRERFWRRSRRDNIDKNQHM